MDSQSDYITPAIRPIAIHVEYGFQASLEDPKTNPEIDW